MTDEMVTEALRLLCNVIGVPPSLHESHHFLVLLAEAGLVRLSHGPPLHSSQIWFETKFLEMGADLHAVHDSHSGGFDVIAAGGLSAKTLNRSRIYK